MGGCFLLTVSVVFQFWSNPEAMYKFPKCTQLTQCVSEIVNPSIETIPRVIVGVHTRTLTALVMLATTVPKGIKMAIFVRVDNVVIKLQDNCKF